MAGQSKFLWDMLTEQLVERIASHLPPNEAACTLRLINKLLSHQLRGYKLVRLSHLVPRLAFVHRWGDERVLRALSLKQREQLLALTARSGSVANLQFALEALGCPPTAPVFDAAGVAGDLDACALLRARDASYDAALARGAARAGHAAVVRWVLQQQPQQPAVDVAGAALVAAAGAGDRGLCEEMLGAGAEDDSEAAMGAAAEAGHEELSVWLLEGLLAAEFAVWDGALLARAAYGFNLAALQRLYHARLGGGGGAAADGAGEDAEAETEGEVLAEFKEYHGRELASAALASPTPDWRAKFEWLEGQGCVLGEEGLDWGFLRGGTLSGWQPLSTRPDAAERLAVLKERGLAAQEQAGVLLRDAVAGGGTPALRHVLAALALAPEDAEASDHELNLAELAGQLVPLAAGLGRVEVLQELLAGGCPVTPEAAREAAKGGHLAALRLLVAPGAGGAAAAEGAELVACGAGSGSLEVVEWLLGEAGCTCDGRAFEAAARAGSVAVLEALAARGCSMEAGAYVEAARNGDLATLRCLRRLGCPWGPPDGTTFGAAVHDQQRYERHVGLAALRWLVEAGCPVDWGRARVVARARAEAAPRDTQADAVLAWVESHIVQ